LALHCSTTGYLCLKCRTLGSKLLNCITTSGMVGGRQLCYMLYAITAACAPLRQQCNLQVRAPDSLQTGNVTLKKPAAEQGFCATRTGPVLLVRWRLDLVPKKRVVSLQPGCCKPRSQSTLTPRRLSTRRRRLRTCWASPRRSAYLMRNRVRMPGREIGQR